MPAKKSSNTQRQKISRKQLHQMQVIVSYDAALVENERYIDNTGEATGTELSIEVSCNGQPAHQFLAPFAVSIGATRYSDRAHQIEAASRFHAYFAQHIVEEIKRAANKIAEEAWLAYNISPDRCEQYVKSAAKAEESSIKARLNDTYKFGKGKRTQPEVVPAETFASFYNFVLPLWQRARKLRNEQDRRGKIKAYFRDNNFQPPVPDELVNQISPARHSAPAHELALKHTAKILGLGYGEAKLKRILREGNRNLAAKTLEVEEPPSD